MYKMCKTEQSAIRQRELEEALLQAMGSCRYEQISVSDLCDQCGVPRKAFYRYFSGKDGALYALIDHTFLRYEEFRLSVTATGVETELERLFRFWKEQKQLLDALKYSNITGVLVSRAVEYAMSDAGMPRHQDSAVKRHAVMFTVCGLMSIVLDWHGHGYDSMPEEMAVSTAKLLMQPLLGLIR